MINKYIIELLHDHNCVVLPGFGGFISRYVSADIHPISLKIIPPSKEIAFNAQLSGDDLLLVNYISSQENISVEQAYTMIAGYIDDINLELSKANIASIEGLGKFYYNINSNIDFLPDLVNNFWEDSFGLGEVILKPIESNYTTMANIPPRGNRQPLRKRPAHKNEESSVKQLSKSKSLDESNQGNNSKTKIAMVLGLILFLFLGIGSLVYTQKNNPQWASIFTMFGNSDTNKTKLSENTTDSTNEAALAENSETKLMESNIASVANISNVETNYHIVIASFQSEANAQQMIDKKSKKDNTLYQIVQPQNGEGNYRVAVAKFIDKDQARAKLSQYRAKYGKDAWILTQ